LGLLNDAGVQCVLSSEYSLVADRPDVIFIHEPEDMIKPFRFTSLFLKFLGVFMVYVPYGVMIGGGPARNFKKFDRPIHYLADVICSQSHSYRSYYDKYCRSGGQNVYVVGHPMVDMVKGAVSKGLIKSTSLQAIRSCYNRIFLWNPHHSYTYDGNDMSSFLKYYEQILTIFSARSDIALIVRPHPLLFAKLKSDPLFGEQRLDNWLSKIARMQNVYLDVDANFLDSIVASDVLLSDISSLIVLFAATKKPVACLCNDTPLIHSGMEELLASFELINSIDSLISYINKAANQDGEIKLPNEIVINDFLSVSDSTSGVRVKNVIDSFFCR
jgi:hypothetical protein